MQQKKNNALEKAENAQVDKQPQPEIIYNKRIVLRMGL